MDKVCIDINCDVGEGNINEANLFPYISSCSIACGGHFGDEYTMMKSLKLAKENKVKIGAHPSYPDKDNFGRISMVITNKELKQSLIYQLQSLDNLLKKEDISLHHIKPHGALYNDMMYNEELSNVFLDAIKKYKETVFLYVPPKSKLEKIALENGFKIKREAFADRNYNFDLSLVSRKLNNALIEKPEDVLSHVSSMVINGHLRTIDNVLVGIKAETYCIHGDTSSALEILRYLSEELPKQNIYIKK